MGTEGFLREISENRQLVSKAKKKFKNHVSDKLEDENISFVAVEQSSVHKEFAIVLDSTYIDFKLISKLENIFEGFSASGVEITDKKLLKIYLKYKGNKQ